MIAVCRAAIASSRTEAVVVGLLAFALAFINSGSLPLIGQDEARFAQAAREMLQNGEAVVPSFGAEPRYDKPILIYWCTMASYVLFGVDEGAARLPSVVASSLAVALLGWWARRRWGAGAGLLAGTLLAVAVVFHFEARAATADQVMLLPALAAMLALQRLWSGEGDVRHAVIFWFGLAVAVLAKGPVAPMAVAGTLIGLWALDRSWGPLHGVAGLALVVIGAVWLGPVVMVIPAVAAVLWLAQRRELLHRLGWWWGPLIAAAIVLPWVVAAQLVTDGEFFRVALGRHVVERGLTAIESHRGFPGFYLLTGLVVAFPWAAVLPVALRRRWSRLMVEPDSRFHLAWLLGSLVILETVQTKMVHYPLITYPAAVLLVVGWIHGRGGAAPRWGWGTAALMVFGGTVLAAAPLIVVLHLGLSQLLWWAAVVAATTMAGTVLAAHLGRNNARRGVLTACATSAAYLLLLMVVFLPRLTTTFIVPRVAAQVTNLQEPGERIVVYELRHDELLFSLPESTVVCRSTEDLAALLGDGGPILVVLRAQDLDEVLDLAPEGVAEVLEEVRGVDLGRGRWCEMLLLRVP